MNLQVVFHVSEIKRTRKRHHRIINKQQWAARTIRKEPALQSSCRPALSPYGTFRKEGVPQLGGPEKKGSYYLGCYIRVPYFRKAPISLHCTSSYEGFCVTPAMPSGSLETVGQKPCWGDRNRREQPVSGLGFRNIKNMKQKADRKTSVKRWHCFTTSTCSFLICQPPAGNVDIAPVLIRNVACSQCFN